MHDFDGAHDELNDVLEPKLCKFVESYKKTHVNAAALNACLTFHYDSEAYKSRNKCVCAMFKYMPQIHLHISNSLLATFAREM